MAKFQNAYHKQVWQLGYATVSAKSLSFEKYDQLMLGLFQDSTRLLPGLLAAGSSGYRFSAAKPLLLLLRDMLAFSLAWSSAVQAHNAGIVAAEDLQDRRGSPLFDQLQQPQFPFAAGFQWQFAPNGTKARQGRRAGVLQLSVLPAAEEHRCFLRLLHKYTQVGARSMSVHLVQLWHWHAPSVPLQLRRLLGFARRCHHKASAVTCRRCADGQACPWTATCCGP